MFGWSLVALTVAAPPSVTLDYDATGTACPPREALEAAVRTRLGLDPFTPTSADRIEVKVLRSGDSLTARVVRRANGVEAGVRELSSPTVDCSELFKAIELQVAIAIDPRAGLAVPRPPPPRPEPPREPPRVPVRAPVTPQGLPAPEPPPTPLDAQVGLGVVGSAGTAPRPTGGLVLGFGLRRGALQLGLGGRLELPVRVATSPGSLTTSLLGGDASVCVVVGLVSGCVVGFVGRLQLTSESVPEPVDTAVLFASLGGRLAVDVSLFKHLILRPFLDVGALLTRTTLVGNGLPIWSTPPVAGQLGLLVVLSSGDR